MLRMAAPTMPSPSPIATSTGACQRHHDGAPILARLRAAGGPVSARGRGYGGPPLQMEVPRSSGRPAKETPPCQAHWCKWSARKLMCEPKEDAHHCFVPGRRVAWEPAVCEPLLASLQREGSFTSFAASAPELLDRPRVAAHARRTPLSGAVPPLESSPNGSPQPSCVGTPLRQGRSSNGDS